MTQLELLQIIFRHLKKIESQMIKKEDLTHIMEQLNNNEERIEEMKKSIEDLSLSVELKHIENINSDELILRSIKQSPY